MTTVVLLGRQGSGKGTQGRLLAERRGWVHLSLGDELRRAVRAGGPRAAAVETYLLTGELVPDSLALAVVRDSLARHRFGAGCVLDGYPRTVRQAELLADAPEGDVGLAVNLAVAPDVVLRRIARRRVCVRCDAVSTGTDGDAGSGADPSACTVCGGPTMRRADDEPAVVRRRLARHEERSRPLLAWYAARGLLVTVDGHGAPKLVAERIERAVVERLGRVDPAAVSGTSDADRRLAVSSS